MEVLRRFLVLGVACLITPGTLNQMVFGTAVAYTYLVMQTQARPFRRESDGFLAMADGFLLTVIFTCCFLIQVNTLNEQTLITKQGEEPLVKRLTPELRDRFSTSTGLLAVCLIISVLGGLLLSIGILMHQFGQERRREQEARHLRSMRRLRFFATKQPVILAGDRTSGYHLFLSHCWKCGGQDIMRVIKQRMKEMSPDVRCFLDVVSTHLLLLL